MRESRSWPAGGCVDTSYRIDLHQLVVPANAGTHNHRCRSWSRLPLQHLITWAFVVMGPGAEAGTTSSVLTQVFKQPILLPSPDAPLRVAGRGRGVFASHTASEFAEAPPTPDPSPPRASRAGGRGEDAPPRSRGAARPSFCKNSFTPLIKGRRECRMPGAPAASHAK